VFANFASEVEDMTTQKAKAPDRRVARTQKLLRDALHSLIREKDYDAIVVKEILDRANVGRSAFYTHFRDKDELLASSIQDILGSVPPPHAKHLHGGSDGILWFSLPVFQHIQQHRATGGLKMGARGRAVLHGQLQRVLVDLIAEEVRKRFLGRRKSAGLMPAGLFAQFVASTFILVLDWWVDNRSSIAAEEANHIFRALIVPTLAATLN
jgi:AcrR family transcriptional regulator